jgi:hypothetical protein
MASKTTHGATGPPKTIKDNILETGAAATQSFDPIKAICAHLNAFHIYASDPSRSVEANHYCTHLSADVGASSKVGRLIFRGFGTCRRAGQLSVCIDGCLL